MSSVTLRAEMLQWIRGDADDPLDQCAHGHVRLAVNDHVYVSPESGLWNVSVAGLYLLRTLSADHAIGDDLTESNFLIPCCGHCPWLVGTGKYRLMCMGCNNGIDLNIFHREGVVAISDTEGHEAEVPTTAWRYAVLNFCASVEAFYSRPAPKTTPDDSLDCEGWQAFWNEWRQRMEEANAV